MRVFLADSLRILRGHGWRLGGPDGPSLTGPLCLTPLTIVMTILGLYSGWNQSIDDEFAVFDAIVCQLELEVCQWMNTGLGHVP